MLVDIARRIEDGSAMQDAIALITTTMEQPDFALLLTQVLTSMESSTRAVACITELATMSGALIRTVATQEERSASQVLQTIALKHRAVRPGDGT